MLHAKQNTKPTHLKIGGWSMKKRLIACLRMAHRCLGMRNKRLGLGIAVPGSRVVLAAFCFVAAGQSANATVIACNPNASSAVSGCTANGGFNFPATDGTGYYSNVTGAGASGAGLSSATVYGSFATVTGPRATAIGLGATASQGAIAIGSVQFTGQDATTGAPTGGTPTAATGLNSIAIGTGAGATVAGGVALGQGSIANRIGLTGASESFSGTPVNSTAGALSVGAVGAERQIINVAGGTQATDAVNVRQLQAVGNNVANSLGGGAAFDPATGAYTAPTYTVGTTNYNNVGAAITALAAAGGGGGGAFASDNTAAAAAPVATGANASAGGYGASATGAGSTVVGNGASDHGNAGAVAVGNNASVLGAGSIAIGQGTTANTAISTQDVADFRTPGNPLKQINNLPAGTTGFVPTGTAIGALSTVGNGGGVAIGYNNNAGNTVQSQVSTAIGADNLASGVNSIALGLNNTASNRGSIAIGTDSQSTGLRAIAMGREAYAYGDFSVAQGYLASAYGANSLSYGPNSVAGVNGGAAAGDVAIGSGATSTLGNSVAIGAGSVASRGAETGYTGFGVGAQTSVGEFAVGTAARARTITGVAAGELGTDAVNVTQLQTVGNNLAGSLGAGAAFDATTGAYTAPLFTTAAGTTATTVQGALANETAGITALGNATAGKLGGGTAYNATTGGIDGGFTVNGTTYADVASAVAGAAANDGIIQRTGTAGVVAVTAPGGTGANPGAAQVVDNVAAGQVAAGSLQAINGSQLQGTAASVAAGLGGGAGVNADGTVSAPAYTVGNQTYNNVGDALAAGNALGVQYTPDAAGNPTNAVDLTKGGTLAPVAVTGLANATAPTGAVALQQMPAQYSTAGAPTTANPAVPSNDVTLVGANGAAPVGLHNIAAGALTATSTDAVNGSQLYTVSGNVDALGTTTAAAIGGGSTYTPGVGITGTSYTLNGAAAPFTNVVAGQQALASGAAGPVQYAVPGTPSNALNLVGTGGPVTLGNVGPGAVTTTSTQAINGSQLQGTAASVAAGLGGGAGVNADGTVSAPTYNVANGSFDNVGSALTALNNGLAGGQLGAFTSNNAAGVAGPVSTGDNASAGGFGASATGAGSTVIGNSGTDNGVAGATVIGSNGSVTQAGGVALGAGSTATRAGLGGATEAFSGATVASTQGAVSVGSVGNERQITNVAGGTQATDAVNVRQLQAVGGDLAGSLGGGAAFDPATGAYTAPLFTTAAGTTATTVQGALANETAGITALGNATATKLGGGTAYNPATGTIDGGFTVNGTTYADVASAVAGAAANDGIIQRTGTAGVVAVTAPGGTGANPGAAQVLDNVAAGQVVAGSLQAINGSQLQGTAASIAAGLGGGAAVNPDGTVSAPAYMVGNQTYNNVGQALAAGNALGVQYTPDAAGNPTNAVDLTKGGTLAPVAVTGVANATTSTGAVALGQMPMQYSTAAAPTTANPAVPSNDVTLVGANAGAPVGLHNVAAGALTATSTDAVNGSQLYATNQEIAALANGTSGLVQQDQTTRAITVGAGTDGTTVGFANNAGAARTLTGVADGQVAAGSTQAINGGQLQGTAASIAAGLGGGAAVNPDGTVSAPTYTVGGKSYNNVGSAIAAGSALGVQYTPDANGNPTNAVDLTKGGTLAPVAVTGLANATTSTGAVALGQMPMQYSTAAAPTTANPGTPSNDVTLVGANAAAPVSLHNVAGGALTATSTDAVNGSQLYATNQEIAALSNGTSGLVQQDPTTRAITVGAGTDGTTVGFANNAGAARTLTGVANGQVAVGSTQAVNGGQLAAVATQVASLGSGTAAAIGGGASYTPDGGLTGPSYKLNGSKTTYTDVVSGQQALASGAAGPVQYSTPGTPSNALNLVGTGGAVTLGNVAPGQIATGSTQAVNGGQLYGNARSVASALGGGARVNADGTISAPKYNVGGTNYQSVGGAIDALQGNMQTSLSNLQNQMTQNNQRLNGGIAGAIAGTGLRYDDRAGKLSTAAAVAGYHGEFGFAGGVGYTAPDQSWRANVAITMNPSNARPDVGAVGGFSYTLN